jgi:hypothetical protein
MERPLRCENSAVSVGGGVGGSGPNRSESRAELGGARGFAANATGSRVIHSANPRIISRGLIAAKRKGHGEWTPEMEPV